ncbi:RNA polymerase sigma-70 factor [Chitinophaga agrisoli]|uniref:RNA polymerase sigma factor n=1 Tax=Chitinophaga agrisoli TaxID=2607653 RepID=A0A5B2VFX5_9BACT|nr:RNA polymerase sigma-70 factor [Chitinophaga agrisoli]KAA2238483.1 RNA polymerase sigma-70 factor [Chitinophaga agrisoli]
MYSMLSEADLLLQVAAGNEMAFRYLFDTRRDKLFAYMLRLSSSSETAEDIVQDTFLRIWTDRGSLPAVRNFDAYLFTIARNHAFNLTKKIAYRRDILDQLTAGQKTFAEDTEHAIQFKVLREQLNRELEKLPSQQKLVFTLSHFQGLPHEDIANRLNISIGTVKKHLSLATQSLRSALQYNLEVILILGLVTWSLHA